MALICPNCGYLGDAKTITKGSLLLEIVLWLCMILPGLIYSIWRRTSRPSVCPSCGATQMIPSHSPRGKQLKTQFQPNADGGGAAIAGLPHLAQRSFDVEPTSKGVAWRGWLWIAVIVGVLALLVRSAFAQVPTAQSAAQSATGTHLSDRVALSAATK